MTEKTLTKADMRKILSSPTLFAIYLLRLKPFRYQAEFLECDSKRIIVVAGRQVGKSTMLAVRAIWQAFTRPNQTILIVAPTFRQAQIVYDRVREMIEMNDVLMSRAVRVTLGRTEFSNGSKIICLPAGKTGETIRGYSADLIMVDEAAFVPDKVFQAIRPSISAKDGALILSGTPYGRQGFFWRIWEEGMYHRAGKKWERFKIKSRECSLISEDFLEEERKTMTALEFMQEYEAEFAEETDEFFPRLIVLENADDYEYEYASSPRGMRVLGIDVARYGMDETAFVVLEHVGEKRVREAKVGEKIYQVVWRKTMAKSAMTEVVAEAMNIVEAFGVKRVVIDETGVGGGAVDIARRVMEDRGVEVMGVEMVGKSRERIYKSLKIVLERKNIRLSMNDEKMLRQFSNYAVEMGKDGRSRIVKREDGHDDLVDALALALYGFERGGYVEPLATDMIEVLDEPEEEGAFARLMRWARGDDEEESWL